MSVEQFGERQKRGAITKVLPGVKFPREVAGHSMIVENGLIKSGDSAKLKIKKTIKSFLIASPVLKFLLFATMFLEKIWQNSFLLPRFYNLICRLYFLPSRTRKTQRFINNFSASSAV